MLPGLPLHTCRSWYCATQHVVFLVQFNKSTARDEKMAEAAAEACRDPGPMPMASDTPERGSSPSRGAAHPKEETTTAAPTNGGAHGAAGANNGRDAPHMNGEAEVG